MTASPYAVDLRPLADPAGLEARWTALEAKAGDGGLFRSWMWVGAWLAALPAEVAPLLLSVTRDGADAGLAVLVAGRQTRHGFVNTRSLHLTETGRGDLDGLTVEYNGLLGAAEDRGAIERAALDALLDHHNDWDELFLSGLTPADLAAWRAAAEARGMWEHARNVTPYYYVDLAAVRDGAGDYMDGLSRNTRQQLRRAVREYEKAGPLALTVAADAEQALAFFATMKDLHQAYWNERGQPGAFANPIFETVHQALIRDHTADGGVQMVRVQCGDADVGYLYNLVHGGRVYGYQSGFCYEADSKRKPGLVSHYLAIEHNIAAGAGVYDFMAGRGQHKGSLSSVQEDMAWITLQRRRPVLRLERGLKGLRRWWLARKAPADGEAPPAG
ncbi:MAG: GNAT family N-acetyltransferase [Rhodobacterales bacterium]|nr:GNAT family N-acetyltransferase [Rhodobacterales bacterium]